MGSDRAIEQLIKTLKDECNEFVKDKIFDSLEKISKKTNKKIYPEQ
jgi:hypothetical protein